MGTAHQSLIAAFAKQPCWKIAQLSKHLNYSIVSVRRFLSNTGYYSSFTHNSSWYTLSTIPRFGQEGLWFYQDIGFSRAGSLTRTIETLITASAAGMSADKLQGKLRCRCHTVLVQMYRKGRIRREKFGRSYIYLAAEPDTAACQLRAIEGKEALRFPAEIAVLIFAEYIRRPEDSFKKLAKEISKRTGLHIKADWIEALFARYGLKKIP